MTQRACAGARLLRRLVTHYPLIRTIDLVRERPWASALFVGMRLTIAVTGDDDARLDEWLIALPGIEITLPAHFVADAEVLERHHLGATIELLLIES